MSMSISIVFVLISVGLTFIATRPESRTSSKQDARHNVNPAQPAKQRKLPLGVKRTLSRVDSLQRLRTDRTDFQHSVGRDFAATEISERIWPPIR